MYDGPNLVRHCDQTRPNLLKRRPLNLLYATEKERELGSKIKRGRGVIEKEGSSKTTTRRRKGVM